MARTADEHACGRDGAKMQAVASRALLRLVLGLLNLSALGWRDICAIFPSTLYGNFHAPFSPFSHPETCARPCIMAYFG